MNPATVAVPPADDTTDALAVAKRATEEAQAREAHLASILATVPMR